MSRLPSDLTRAGRPHRSPRGRAHVPPRAASWAHPGALSEHPLSSTVLAGGRKVTVYEPPAKSGPHPLVVLIDWGDHRLPVGFGVGLLFDNMIAARRIPPLVVALVENTAPPPAELACHPGVPSMVADDLLPLLLDRHDIDASRTIVAGSGLGGLCAAHVAFQRPESFGAVIAISGAFSWGEHEPQSDGGWGQDGKPEWLTRQYAAAEPKPIRFWLTVGPVADGCAADRAAAAHLRAVLRTLGYDVGYRVVRDPADAVQAGIRHLLVKPAS